MSNEFKKLIVLNTPADEMQGIVFSGEVISINTENSRYFIVDVGNDVVVQCRLSDDDIEEWNEVKLLAISHKRQDFIIDQVIFNSIASFSYIVLLA